MTVPRFTNMKSEGRKITMLTAYDYPMAAMLDETEVDGILVGDSMSMVVQGHETTLPVTFEEVLYHARAVARGTQYAHLVADLPFMAYQVSKEQALTSAGRMMKDGGVGAVKMEGGERITESVFACTQAGIPVMGHVGLLPQYAVNFKTKGKNINQRKAILEDAIVLSKCGVFAIVIECVIESLAKEITNKVKVPTIGIGASRHCDGQILVTDDMIGLSNFHPKFVRKYSNVRKMIESSVKKYSQDIKNKKFPSSNNVYNK